MKRESTSLSIFSRRDGSIAVEAALVFPFFLIALLGVIEISQFIQAKERLNKVTNQVTKVLSVPSSQDEIDQVLTVALAMAEPEAPNIDVLLCGYDLGGGMNFSFHASAGDGVCGYGSRGGGLQIAATCPPPPSASNPGFASTVNVTTSCNYSPQFDAVGLFDGLQVIASTSMPMQGDPASAFAP